MSIIISCKGDVYIDISESRKHPLTRHMNTNGSVFGCVAKNTRFDYWHARQEGALLQSSLVDESKLGYYDLQRDSLAGFESSFSGVMDTLGVFIPNMTDKGIVADDLRKRFGPGTILLKPGVMEPPDDNLKYLSWIKAKHRLDGQEFVADLLYACAVEFAKQQPSSGDLRAKIYANKRHLLECRQDSGILRHLKTRFNS